MEHIDDIFRVNKLLPEHGLGHKVLLEGQGTSPLHAMVDLVGERFQSTEGYIFGFWITRLTVGLCRGEAKEDAIRIGNRKLLIYSKNDYKMKFWKQRAVLKKIIILERTHTSQEGHDDLHMTLSSHGA
tara:strand:+ start:42 stop:425 length:384 start_codon:yes stop_codon:yes gene_type:complete